MGTAQSRNSQNLSSSLSISDENEENEFPNFPHSSHSPTPSTSSAEMISHENESDDEFVDCLNFDTSAKPLEGPSSTKHQQQQNNSDDDASDDESLEKRRERQRKEMEEFREEMKQKREMRHSCMKKLREEMIDLREKLASEMETNTKLRETLELHGVSDGKSFDEINNENKKLKAELAECQMYLQTSNSENINKTLEVQALREHIRSLKEVIKATKEMLNIRENQVQQMKSKLTEIEESFAEKETQLMSKALQQEYQRQLENIRNMRELYEQRANLLSQERDSFKRKFEDKEHDLETEIEKSKKLEEFINTLENNLKLKSDDISHLENDISVLKSQKSQVTAEMTAVNQLIAQVLLGFDASGSYIDIDKLVNMLEQNRDLLNEMAIKEDYAGIDEGSFLPKLLFDIFLQANQNEKSSTKESATSTNDDEENEIQKKNTPEEIAEKLPKVWRVLTELLSHQQELSSNETEEDRILDNCYKTIQTVSGPQNVLSVSKTFIKLKDLIIEKRSLQKDTGRLKTLYSHLEQRLDKQEKRLSSVSLELMKTWHLVGKLKRQHRQLHTHEQILCYQLQQKRRVLGELKAELEYCRKKWALARALNNDSEEQCKQLRHEFSQRKIQDQNSAESGYSDDHPSSDGDDDEITPKTSSSIKQKFNENLTMFDRTTSPTFSERRQSESPVMLRDFSNALCVFSRAQSEPPRIPSPMLDRIDENDSQTFEILELIPESEDSEICVAFEVPQNDRHLAVSTPPPQVLMFEKPKLRAQMRKCKKEQQRQERAKNGTATAEDMFTKLMNQGRIECDTCSSTTVSIDEDEYDNLDEIQEIPLDDVIEEIDEATTSTTEDFAVKIETEQQQKSADVVEVEIEKSDFEILTEKEQEFLKRREERLQRLEAEAKAFYEKMAKNRDKGQQLNNHLNEVHQNFLHRQRERTKSTDEDPKNEDDDQPRPSTSKDDNDDDGTEQK